jgi:hypothetical protein
MVRTRGESTVQLLVVDVLQRSAALLDFPMPYNVCNAISSLQMAILASLTAPHDVAFVGNRALPPPANCQSTAAKQLGSCNDSIHVR